MSAPTREQFVEQVITHVRGKFPLVKIGRAEEQSFSVVINGYPASLENLYRLSMLRPDETQHHVDRWIVELLRAAEGPPDQLEAFDEIKPRLLPMVLAIDGNDTIAAHMVTQPLVPGLIVSYAVDHDRTISYVPQRTFDTWKMTVDELHEIALTNLVARSESLAAHASQDEEGRVNLILFQTMDGYDASRILLPSLHERLREYLGSPFVAGIPNRDILLCFRNDDETVPRLKSQIAQDFQQMPHQVTDQLLLVTPDGIALRDPKDDDSSPTPP
jgi:hypothetical protein